MKIRWEVVEGKELAQKFRNAGIKAQGFIDKALNEAAFLVERTAKIYQTPHVDTGRLRASISTRLLVNNAEIGTVVEYARKHEKDYPFLKPALDDKTDEIRKILNRGLQNVMASQFKGFTTVF